MVCAVALPSCARRARGGWVGDERSLSISRPPLISSDPLSATTPENAPAKAENFLSFYADDVTLSNGDTLVFTNPSQELSTSFGDVNLAKTFAPGAFKPTQK